MLQSPSGPFFHSSAAVSVAPSICHFHGMSSGCPCCRCSRSFPAFLWRCRRSCGAAHCRHLHLGCIVGVTGRSGGPQPGAAVVAPTRSRLRAQQGVGKGSSGGGCPPWRKAGHGHPRHKSTALAKRCKVASRLILHGERVAEWCV